MIFPAAVAATGVCHHHVVAAVGQQLHFRRGSVGGVHDTDRRLYGQRDVVDTGAGVDVGPKVGAAWCAFLQQQQLTALPATASRSLLLSANAGNPGALAKFRAHGGKVSLAFDLAKAARNASETARTTTNFVLIAVGGEDAATSAAFRSASPMTTAAIAFEKGIALSNAGLLADGNAGVPLPLNALVGLDTDQVFTLELDAAANPGVNLTNLREIMLLVEYNAQF